MPGNFNRLPPRPEYLVAVLQSLAGQEPLSLAEVTKRSGLSQTQASQALDVLARDQKVMLVKEDKSPKVRYRLNDT